MPHRLGNKGPLSPLDAIAQHPTHVSVAIARSRVAEPATLDLAAPVGSEESSLCDRPQYSPRNTRLALAQPVKRV